MFIESMCRGGGFAGLSMFLTQQLNTQAFKYTNTHSCFKKRKKTNARTGGKSIKHDLISTFLNVTVSFLNICGYYCSHTPVCI